MKYIFSILICFSLLGILLAFGTPNTENTEYLRIHIRANSNLTMDQDVKYEVKDKVVDYMIPLLSSCKTKKESINIISNNINNIEKVAKQVLVQNGFEYSVKAKINNEQFPTRTYGNLTLESGFYDALILELGEGVGDNWWCVVYPPLCFVNGSTSVSVYKSRIVEIINSFFK